MDRMIAPGLQACARGLRLGVVVGAGMAVTAPATAASFLDSTHLLDVRQGSVRSDAVRQAGRGGYQLAGGSSVDLAEWYSADWPDLHVSFLTQVGENTGLIWGFSTGERGEKYRISPGIRLGLVHAFRLTEASTLTLTASVQLGSKLREESCTADYGAIGGVQQVTCRLAAAPMAPEETLRHRLAMDGLDDSRIALSYEFRF